MQIEGDELRRFRNEHIAMVFQNFALMPHRSVLDNVAMPLEIRGISKNQRMEIAHRTLEMVELTGWGNKFAHELSGGMQQRVGLARAIAADPEILLMDEPFSALDPLIRRQLQGQFMELASVMKKTTVFITHHAENFTTVYFKTNVCNTNHTIVVFQYLSFAGTVLTNISQGLLPTISENFPDPFDTDRRIICLA